MAGTLVIGVGGTGIKTLVHVKKQLQDSRQDGKLPSDVQILGIDTRQAPEGVSGIGSWHNAQARRQLKEYKGDVTIDPNTEYFWLGGALELWTCGNQVNGIDGVEKASYITRWFDLKYFCNNPARAALLNVTNGAGMYRQIGRLGLFHHLQNGTGSLLYQRLAQKLTSISEGSITVILCGSLAGGTGAALFQDIAHLLKTIGELNGKTVNVTAMLVLPEAFSWTPHLAVNPAMRARAFAAMREMVRFMTVSDSALGFRMQYTKENVQELNNCTKGALFSIVYLLEKRAMLPQQDAPSNPLSTKIEYGVAPTMGAWIASLCDHTIAAEYGSWEANIKYGEGADAHLYQGLVPALCGSFGTYSIVLPKASIIEKWTAMLAKDILEQLAPRDAQDLFETKKVGNRAVTAGNVKAGEDWKKNPSHIARDAGDLGERDDDTTHTELVKQVMNRSVNDWRTYYLDETASDEQSKTFEEMMEQKTYFFNHWKKYFWIPYDKGAVVKHKATRNYDKSPDKAGKALHEECENKYQELESHWVTAINQLTQHQFDIFSEASLEKIAAVLNGKTELLHEQIDATLNRPGSLTWLMAYTKQQVKDLDKTVRILDDAQKTFEVKIRSLEAEWVAGSKQTNPILAQMKKDERKQKDYLKKRQEWLEAKRCSLLCSKELALAKKMYLWTNHLFERLESFALMINGIHDSISQWVDERIEDELSVNRDQASITNMEKVRELVRDEQWEEDQYKKFLNLDPNSPNGNYRVLQNINWKVREITVKGQDEGGEFQAPEPELSISGWPLELDGGPLADNRIITKSSRSDRQELYKEIQNNAYRLLEICRLQFVPAWDKLTVIDYLKYKYNSDTAALTPQALATEKAKMCNVLLSASVNASNKLTNMAYLLVPSGTQEDPFLQLVLGQLKVEVRAADEFNRVLEHADSTTLTFLVLTNGYNIKTLDAYKLGATPYLQLRPKGEGVEVSRQINHLFRAEKEATLYDRLNPDGNHYLVSSRVSMPLEEPELLDRFLTALSLKLIKHQSVPITRERAGSVFQASLKVKKNIFGTLQETTRDWWLNNPDDYSGREVDYLAAAECFCLRSLDHSSEPQSIDELHAMMDDAVLNGLEEKLTKEYLPHWQKGGVGCTANQITAAQEPNPSTRQSLLNTETTKQLWRELVPDIEARLKRLLGLPEEERQVSKTIPDEIEFLKILLSRIQNETKE